MEEVNATEKTRLFREHKEAVERRVEVVEEIKRVAAALKTLGAAIDRRADIEAVSRDGILHRYIDVTRIGALVVVESELTKTIADAREELMEKFGLGHSLDL